MRQTAADLLVKEMKAAGIDFVVTLPDTGFREIYYRVKDDPSFQFVPVTNEGEGASIAAGAWLGGKKPVLMMENSGLRVASDALARLSIGIGIPVLLLMSYRGCMGDGNWWAINHGVVMEPMLKVLRIPYLVIESENDIEGSLQKAWKTLSASVNHVAVVMGGGTLW